MSSNKMKRKISIHEISKIFSRHSLGNIRECELLTGGEFNSVWKVIVDDSQKYVIKIAPSNKVEVLTYEKNLIKSEVIAYQKLSGLQTIYVPKLYGYNWSDDYPYHYLIMEFIEGQTLLNAKLSASKMEQVMFDLGKVMAEIHCIEGLEGFGYIQNGLKTTWKDAYLEMINNIINDGVVKKAKIHYLDRIKLLIKENESLLEEIKHPSFVHFDLWAGNIILKNEKLYAIIDCERAMFGDIMGEFISLDYIEPFNPENNKALIDGYQSFGGKSVTFNKNEMIRLYLMRLYLGLITNVEIYYRYSVFSPEFHKKMHFQDNL